MVWGTGFEIYFPEFKSHCDHLLDLFQVLPGSAPKLNEQVVIIGLHVSTASKLKKKVATCYFFG